MEQNLKDKIERVFGNLVVDKRQALQAGFELMPRFVTEFLLAAARQKSGAMDVSEVRDRVRRFSVDADRKAEFVSRLMREGHAKLIALLEVEPRPERNCHVGRVVQLDGHELDVSESLVAQFPELLYGGLWGSCLLKYDTSGARPRMVVADFSPYQLTRPDMELFRRARAEFTLDEWTELLITSAGYRPEAFPTFRSRLLLLTRLVPLTQPNVNLIELGPRGTGKSYLLRNMSSRCYLLAGARATPATLLYDLSRRQVGIVGRKKVVIFDEVAATQFPDISLVAALKDYMESGHISRGGRSLVGDCSFFFTGNIDMDPDGRTPHRDYLHLFEVLPHDLCDSAVADRIHGFIPGWEMPKISDAVLADGTGLLTDYFGEVLGELRKDVEFHQMLKDRLSLENATHRDRRAIEKVGAGLLKMLYPDGKVEDAGFRQVLQVAAELRQRVHNQLERMAPGEYAPKCIGFPGMLTHVAADMMGGTRLEEHDVEANQRALVGKITILVTADKGGGGVGFVECAHVEGRGLKVTGLRGAVLDQSVQAAYDALLNLGGKYGLTAEKLRSRKMAVHLVNMAEFKDGPSAGLAFALAMFSAATGRRIVPSLAVTGELSIHGNVGAVGAIPEKVSAAQRNGRKLVLIPAANAEELSRIPEIVANVDVRPMRTFREAVEVALEKAMDAAVSVNA
ncbi:MAG: BREX system Lon protease-like protein BrxL [Myxococcota bacterium]